MPPLLCSRHSLAGSGFDLLDLFGFVELTENGAAAAVAHDPGDGKGVMLGVAAKADPDLVADRDMGRQLDVVIKMAGEIRAHRQLAGPAGRDGCDLVGYRRRERGEKGDEGYDGDAG